MKNVSVLLNKAIKFIVLSIALATDKDIQAAKNIYNLG